MMSDLDSNYYLSTALQSMETAYDTNHDITVANHIAQALSALHQLSYQAAEQSGLSRQTAANDPYDMDEFNSTI